jgi:hypothetical protein
VRGSRVLAGCADFPLVESPGLISNAMRLASTHEYS